MFRSYRTLPRRAKSDRLLGGSLNAVVGGSGNTTVMGAPGGYTAVTLGNGNDTVHPAQRYSAPEPAVSCRDDQPARLALHGDGDHHEPA